jgi:superfamily I DNA/RNA helicase
VHANRATEDAGCDLAPLLQAELGETVAEYQNLKERTGRLDFLDLLIRARDLFVQSRSVRQQIDLAHGRSGKQEATGADRPCCR